MKTIIEKFDLYKDGNERRLFYREGKDYASSNDKKIFVVHDAHNMFEKKYTSYLASWNIVHALETQGITDYLIFGLECLPGSLRLREYSPVDNRKELVKEFPDIFDTPYIGVQYIDSLYSHLIPYMEKKMNFNFKESKTTMIGSSMGGVITTYAALHNPDKFDSYIAFSNAFYANEPFIFDYIKSKTKIGRYYQYMGGHELSGSISDNIRYIAGYEKMYMFLNDIEAEHKCVFNSEGVHNEKDWAAALSDAIGWAIKNIKP